MKIRRTLWGRFSGLRLLSSTSYILLFLKVTFLNNFKKYQRQSAFYKKVFRKFTWKDLCRSLIFDKVALYWKRVYDTGFFCKFCEIFIELLRWLLLNLIPANVPILYPLKTPENQIIFGVFRRHKTETLARNGLNILKMLVEEFIFTNIYTFQSLDFPIFVVLYTIWCYLHNLENVENTHGGVLPLVKLEASACNFTKSNNPPWVSFTFFKLYKLYQITEIVLLKCFFRNIFKSYKCLIRNCMFFPLKYPE